MTKLLPPIQTTGKVKIPVVNKKVPKMIAIGLFGAGLIGIYFVLKKRGFGGALRTVDIAPDVDFVIIPSEVRPDSFVTVSGTFLDEKGKPVITKSSARYVVFENDTTNGQNVITSGLIGSNISTFSFKIPTTAFKQSTYSIKVTDGPMTQDEIAGASQSLTPGAQRNPSLSTNPGFGISVS